MSEEQKVSLEKKVSLTLGVGFALWDAYCQATGIPYTMPTFVYGIVMYPWGEKAYSNAKEVIAKIPSVTKDVLQKLAKKSP